jgi:hypothetical protein
MPAFTLDICRFRLTFTEGAAILVIGHNAVATRMGALLYISHGLDSPERLIAQPGNPFKVSTSRCGREQHHFSR